MANGYIVQFGNTDTPAAIIAYPNKRGEPVGGGVAEHFVRVGTHQILNQSRVWARRVMGKDGSVKTAPDGGEIQLNTPGYRGELEFLPWGDPNGHQMEIRFLSQSQSLDFEFQENVQRIKLDSTNTSPYLEFKTGQNQFDFKKDALKIQFLKVHPQNKNSVSKNPDPLVKGSSFFEITDENVDQNSIKRIEGSAEAVMVIKDISSKPGNMKNLFRVLGLKKIGNTTELSTDLEIYKTMLEYASINPGEFFQQIEAYKMSVLDACEKAKSFKALDLTKNGHIAWVYGGKTDLIISDAKGKGEDMIMWLIDNYYEEEVYKATQTLKDFVSKLK
jgi:hypothetical protein